MSGEEKETILFVDDEENILRSLRRLFHREGYHILLAKSGRKGLELLQEHPVDLVVSDVRMPEMNGVEFLNRVRKTHPEVACMVLSGYAERKAVSRIFSEINIQEMVAKPWDDSELKQTIRDLLNRKETQKDFSPGLYELINSFEALPPTRNVCPDGATGPQRSQREISRSRLRGYRSKSSPCSTHTASGQLHIFWTATRSRNR